MKIVLLLLAVITLSSCGSLKTDINYDKNIDFSKYKTISWVDMKGKLSSYHLNQDADVKAKKFIESQIEKAGLKFVEGNDSDLIINYLIQQNRAIDVRSFDVSFGYHPYSTGMYGTYNTLTYVSTRENESGALMLDLVDRKSKQLVWRGSANKNFAERSTPQDKLEAFVKIIEKITKNFPPTKK
ncbi:DUF4136 domain-containing protein [Halobacteriovorax sp. HLS]|uniref:DUF4136 domain-containing protein n=1 Tax=Halobacteriovorax sp. HLS TaxID=2234000 RepID=UPI000FDA532B|nr:DUF4136 domain-containing protein [Halobacteriovorax sp. HLS]